jgi:hypothetical protein
VKKSGKKVELEKKLWSSKRNGTLISCPKYEVEAAIPGARAGVRPIGAMEA